GGSTIHEISPQRVKAIAGHQVASRMTARCRGGDALGDVQQPRPVDVWTDELQRTAEVIEIDGNGHIPAGLAAPSDIVSHDEPVDASGRCQLHQVLTMRQDKTEEPGVALPTHAPS